MVGSRFKISLRGGVEHQLARVALLDSYVRDPQTRERMRMGRYLDKHDVLANFATCTW